MSHYGQELILDLHNCTGGRFTRNMLEKFFKELCDLISMEREDLHFWDYEGREDEYNKAPAHLKGISAIQFIKTSNITIHTLDEMKRVYLNIFSCKRFDPSIVKDFTRNYFSGDIVTSTVVERK